MKSRFFMVGLTAALLCSGCGFHLRGSAQDVAIAGAKVAIVSASPYAELNRSLREALTRAKVESVTDPDAQLVINLREEKLTRRTQTVDQYGRPSDYELIYTLRYSLHKATQSGDAETRSVSARRDYGFDNRDLLGKAEEENELVREMQAEIAQRLLRQIRYALADTPTTP